MGPRSQKRLSSDLTDLTDHPGLLTHISGRIRGLYDRTTMAPTTIHVKATSGSKITVPVELSVTVGELKTTLEAADKADTPSAQQRLIYKAWARIT
jgi:hypothetical protein